MNSSAKPVIFGLLVQINLSIPQIDCVLFLLMFFFFFLNVIDLITCLFYSFVLHKPLGPE